MRLRTYMKRHSVTVRTLARKSKCSTVTIYNILAGKHVPRLDLAARLSKATAGKVAIGDLLDVSREQDETEPLAA